MNVLVTALDWGLGHTARVIPILRELQSLKCILFFAGNTEQCKTVQQEIGDITAIELKELGILYGKGRSQILRLALKIPHLIRSFSQEQKHLNQLVDKHQIKLIISDNRYSFFCPKAHSIFITHQINIELPRLLKFIAPIINKLNRHFINQFDACWIPDLDEPNDITGRLGHKNVSKLKRAPKYIGHLTRMKLDEEPVNEISKFDLLVLISGPENQRSVFEDLILSQLKLYGDELSYRVIRGVSDEVASLEGNVINHVDPNTYRNYILGAKNIICRAGYSTIMDLLALNKTALLVATPGQTEQEYLAKHLSKRKFFLSQDQSQFNLLEALNALYSFKSELDFSKYTSNQIGSELKVLLNCLED